MTHPSQLPVDVARIQKLLPHRYPFLLVDRVVEFEPHKRVLAYKNVSINEPFFQGHFPGHPVMPGVLVIEALAQAGGVLTQLSHERRPRRQAVLPGQDRQRPFSQDGGAGRPAGTRGHAQAHDPQHGAVRRRRARGRRASRLRRNPLRRGQGLTHEHARRHAHPPQRGDRSGRASSAPACSVGAFAIIGADVEIGDGTSFGPHCSVTRPDPHRPRQPLHRPLPRSAAIRRTRSSRGERIELVIGDRNIIREFITINRGTGSGGGITRIGDDNWLLAYTHVAHDCIVGNHCVFSNNATLAGHVDSRRLGDPQRLRRHPPVLPHRRARLHRHGRVRQRRRAAVRDGRARRATAGRAASTAKASSAAVSTPNASARSSAPTARCTCPARSLEEARSSWPNWPRQRRRARVLEFIDAASGRCCAESLGHVHPTAAGDSAAPVGLALPTPCSSPRPKRIAPGRWRSLRRPARRRPDRRTAQALPRCRIRRHRRRCDARRRARCLVRRLANSR